MERIWIPIPFGLFEGEGVIARTPGDEPVMIKPAQGGGFTVRRGGALLANVKELLDGGFKLQLTAQSPIYLRPCWGGGYTIEEAGVPTIRVDPTREGGYIIKTPGEVPTHVRPNWGGGFTIDPPSGSSTTVSSRRGLERLDDAPVPVPVFLAGS